MESVDALGQQPSQSPPPEEVIRSAASETAKKGLSERQLRASISGYHVSKEYYRRALYLIERREIVLESRPGGSSRDVRPAPIPELVDPWAVAPESLRSRTEVTCLCFSCLGSKVSTCARCAGRGRTACSRCDGSGKIIARSKSQWFKNCPSCRGKGDQRCGFCRNGKIDCLTCNRIGRLTAWLACRVSSLQQVKVDGRGAASSVHRGLETPADFDAGASVWCNTLIQDSGFVPPPSIAEPGLRPDLEATTDRCQFWRLQRFCSTVHALRFAGEVGEGEVLLAGRHLSVASNSTWSGLEERSRLVRRYTWLLAIVSFLLYATYVGIHPWYGRYGSGGIALGSSLLMVGFARLLWRERTLIDRARSPVMVWVARCGIGCLTLVAILVYLLARPSANGAMAALNSGDTVRANLESEALITLGIDVPGGNQVQDAVHLRQVKAATELKDILQLNAEPWHTREMAQQASTHASTVAADAILKSLASSDASAIEDLAVLLKTAPNPFPSEFAAQIELLQAKACLLQKKLECVVARLEKGKEVPGADIIRTGALELLDSSIRSQLRSASAVLDPALRRKTLGRLLEQAKLGRALEGVSVHPLEKLVWRQLSQLRVQNTASESNPEVAQPGASATTDAVGMPGDSSGTAPATVPLPLPEKPAVSGEAADSAGTPRPG